MKGAKRYTVTFLFSPEFELVWLIEKQKPDWQKGCLNGIGGKIEYGESAICCAIRELSEEAGINVSSDDLVEIGRMEGENNDGSKFEVYIYAGRTELVLTTQEEEKIGLYRVDEIKKHRHIENVPMLIEASIYRLIGGSNFNTMVMNYNR
jgi:8-oxo-dGTP pyrophosphatase MutT (NUDIX family)